MEQNVNNATLMHLSRQIADMQRQGSIFTFLLRNKIQEFMKDNGERMQSLNEKLHNLQKFYFELDDQGNVKTIEVTEKNEQGQEVKQRKPIMLPDRELEGYNKAYSDLMNEQTLIKY